MLKFYVLFIFCMSFYLKKKIVMTVKQTKAIRINSNRCSKELCSWHGLIGSLLVKLLFDFGGEKD